MVDRVECGIINGTPTPCTRPNECCSNSNICGPCTRFIQKDLCGPCTTPDCFDTSLNYVASFQCPQQVGAFKDCIVKKSECVKGVRTVIINRLAIPSNGKSLGGIPCPTLYLENCYDCEVRDWLPCMKNSKRTRIITQAINGGKECTEVEKALPTEQTCNNCEVSEWSDCSNNRIRRTKTITKNATNGGTCDGHILSEPCNDCVGNWSEWLPCEANCNQFDYAFNKTKIGNRKRIYLSNINEDCKIKEGGIKDGTIDTDYYCTKKCNIDCSNDENCDKNFFNNIIKFFNLIILFFKKLFKL